MKYLARSTADAQRGLDETDISVALEAAIDTVATDYPDISFESVSSPDQRTSVWGNVMFERALEHVLDRAASEGGTERVEIAVETDDLNARIRVSDDGPGLTDAQRAILEEGASGAYTIRRSGSASTSSDW